MQKTRKIYTVSEINSLIKGVLESNLPSRLTITGEITDFKVHHSGHCYFSLKDEDALLPCVMWRSNFKKVKFRPENGLAALATGYVDVYVPGGKYQLYVDRLDPAGVGALQLAFEQMVKKLQAQGLFDEKFKKPLPSYPDRIAILTSESGAAIADIQNSIHNRWPCAKLFLYPVPVQGDEAAEKIAAAVTDINRRNNKLKIDILIVGRGGGSLEDLWAFNEEVLARAIFDSKIPVISAVGHEVDTTIADFVADARASTPTKAGVVAVPDIHEVLKHLAYLQERAHSKVESLLRNSEQQSDELLIRLAGSVRQLLADTRARLYTMDGQIRKIEPHRLLRNKMLDLNNLSNRAKAAVKDIVEKVRLRLTAETSLLVGLNPKSVLQRGYSITT
ncbi:MAG: exodeoxyribonuclease VII large subunit, partial [Planctomycetota bacterium]